MAKTSHPNNPYPDLPPLLKTAFHRTRNILPPQPLNGIPNVIRTSVKPSIRSKIKRSNNTSIKINNITSQVRIIC